MLLETLRFLFKTVSDLFVLVVLLRFYLQLVRAPFQHPLAQFVVSLTNFAVLPLRRWVPSIKHYDSATLLLALLVSLCSTSVLLVLSPYPFNFTAPPTWLGVALLSILELFRASLHLLMGAVIVQAILSWVSPYNPLAPLLNRLTAPFLQPFRRLNVGGVDLSPLALLLLIQVILMLPVAWIEQSVFNLLTRVLS